MTRDFTLLEAFRPAELSRKFGFTLTEVLITLGIIGVVAAITMPSLIQNHQKKVFVTKAKNAYSIVSNALYKSVQENGAPNTWDFGETWQEGDTNNPEFKEKAANLIENTVNTYFAPYIKYIDKGFINNTDTSYYLKLTNGTILVFQLDSGNNADPENPTFFYKTLYIAASFNGNKSYIGSYTRDFSRHDFLMVVFRSTASAKIDIRNINLSRTTLINTSAKRCNKNNSKGNRWDCSTLLVKDGWEIKDDYPW